MDTRYSSKMKEEYAVQKIVTPSFVVLQKNVGKEIKNFFKDKEIIVADLGSGTGFTAEEVLIKNPKARVICVDIDPEMLSYSKQLLEKFTKNKRAELKEEDVLSFLKQSKKQSFDAVASALTIHNFKKKYRHEVLKEIFRVLKKNGLFVNSDKYNSSNPEKNKEWLEYHSKHQRDKALPLGKQPLALEWNRHNEKDNTPSLVQLEEESIKEMQEIGFRNIKMVYRDHLVGTMVAGK